MTTLMQSSEYGNVFKKGSGTKEDAFLSSKVLPLLVKELYRKEDRL